MSEASEAPDASNATLPLSDGGVPRSGARAEAAPALTDTYAIYLAKRFLGEKHFQDGYPQEASPLAATSDVVLTKLDYGLALVCIVDRIRNPAARFALSKDQAVAVGKECLKYTGTMNGVKMPVGVYVFEVGDGAPSAEDRARLEGLKRKLPGLEKVGVYPFYVDAKNKKLEGGGWGLTQVGYRGWIEGILREKAVKPEAQIYVPDAVMPKTVRKPFATIGILAVLAAMFAVEQVAKVSDKGSGPLGLDTPSLFALGGMNKTAVLHDHQWYRLFTAALLHADAAHIALNGLALWMAGVMLEMLIGPVWFVALFFLGALGGSLMGLLLNPANIVSIGASGAVMGLFAAAVATSMRFPEGRGRTQIQTSLLQVLIPSLIPLAYRSGESVDIAAHLGGAIAGGFAGYGLMKIWPRDQEHVRFPGLAKGLAALGVGCFVVSVGLAKHAYPEYAAEAAFDAADLLVPDESIPDDPDVAAREVDTWGAKHPRDPRVHLYRAFKLSEAGDNAAAEKELRDALTEREIFARAFPSGHVERNVRGALADMLVEDGKVEEAKKEAAPICREDPAESAEVGASMRKMGLCE